MPVLLIIMGYIIVAFSILIELAFQSMLINTLPTLSESESITKEQLSSGILFFSRITGITMVSIGGFSWLLQLGKENNINTAVALVFSMGGMITMSAFAIAVPFQGMLIDMIVNPPELPTIAESESINKVKHLTAVILLFPVLIGIMMLTVASFGIIGKGPLAEKTAR